MTLLGAQAQTLGWRIETIRETGSTNDLILDRARKGAAEGLVIRAKSQSKGRGRRGRSWFSPHGDGLYFSALLRPNCQAEILPALTLLVGVAVAEGLGEATGCHIGLKWPNDLRVGRKKMGGILCEYTAMPGELPAIVAGVGINLTTKETDFPPHLRERASSILHSGGKVPAIEHLLAVLLRRIAFWYAEYQSSGFGAIQNHWHRLCDHLGERISVCVADRRVRGKTMGIDERGRLLLEHADGTIQRISSGEVELV